MAETSSTIKEGPRSIAGVPTSTAAFIGETERGALRPQLVNSYADYKRWFGSTFHSDCYMPHAANGFFENGGLRLVVCRIVGVRATTAWTILGDFTVRAIGPGAWGSRVWVKIQDGSTVDELGKCGFRLKVAYWSSVPPGFTPFDPFEENNRDLRPLPQQAEDYDNLQLNPDSEDFFEKRLIDSRTNKPASALAILERTVSRSHSKPPNTAQEGLFLDHGGADDPNALESVDFMGAVAGGRAELQGLRALEQDEYRDVSLVYAPHPNHDSINVVKEVIQHCERSRFRFAAIDSLNSVPADLDPRTTIGDTANAAYYAPWLVTSDPETAARLVVPPVGHVLGIYSRIDAEQGIFRAPANEIVRGALGLSFAITGDVQDAMTLAGVNAIREFPGRGIRVWGARTLSSNSLWRYVSVRRLFIYLERSIYEGTQWVVFEPNDEPLWAQLRDAIKLFLRSQWRLGALQGRREEEAFYVNCGRSTMSGDDILNGRLICEIGVAPVRPAEFVIFRLMRFTAESHE